MGKRMYAHRASFIAFNGPLAEGMFACHRCDTPCCVNPDHLFAGAPIDNSRDAVAKGRHPHGEKNGTHKLTASDVLSIRSLLGAFSDAELGRRFKVSTTSVRSIRIGRTWKQLKALTC